jgi:uncharacterized membrane protein
MKSNQTRVFQERQLLQAEVWISFVLRYGVLTCAFVIGVGFIARLIHVGQLGDSTREITRTLLGGGVLSEPPPYEIHSLFNGVIHLNPDVIMAAGLILLITLPIVRVAMTVILFLIDKDWPFLLITSFVLVVLMFGILCGHGF